jgi:formamidopyrimidine-DNA glycosylase
MPELPEVETVKLQLQKYLIGHKIEDVQIKIPKLFSGDTKDVVGGKFTGVRRFAKVLSLDLSNGFSIIIHIKLTGQLIYRGPNLRQVPYLSKKIVGGVPGPHTHVIFKLDKGGFLYYNDIRRFGWLRVIKTAEVETSSFIGKLGPEPFINPDCPPVEVLTLERFQNILSKTSRAVKVVLMDQSKIGGVGNIYANDALWLAKINPRKESKKLGNTEVKNLYEAIHAVLKDGLKYGGASELSFVTPDGAEGKYQDHTLSYGHEKELCKRCKKGIITKYFLGGRGTYWCPNCQQ